MKSSSEEVRREFIQLWSQLAKVWGISGATARVYAWLFSQAKGSDTEEIMAGLKVGRGTISTACRELQDWGLLAAEQEPGGRRLRYTVETDLVKVIRSIILRRKSREWDPILEHTRDWIPRLEADRTPEAGLFRARLRALANCLALADTTARHFLGGAKLENLDMQDLAHPRRDVKPPVAAG